MPPPPAPTVCLGPIAYKGQALLENDLAAFKAALQGVAVAEAFVPAIAPAMVGRGQNRYYPTEEAYVFAIAEALRTEYQAIVDAGFILQIDDPGLGETWDMLIPAPSLEDYRKMQARNIDALNHALAGIPEDRVRYHLCWGSWQGPHLEDLGPARRARARDGRRRLRLRAGRAVPAPAPDDHVGQVPGPGRGSAAGLAP